MDIFCHKKYTNMDIFLIGVGEEKNHKRQRRRNIPNRACTIIFGRG